LRPLSKAVGKEEGRLIRLLHTTTATPDRTCCRTPLIDVEGKENEEEGSRGGKIQSTREMALFFYHLGRSPLQTRELEKK